MSNLVLPERVTIQLIDNHRKPFALSNVLLTVCLFARRKNDFFLGPYVSNASGIVEITGLDLRHDIDATYDSGLMDYVAAENAFSFVEIRLEHPDDIDRALKSRTTAWTSLLKGEKERWGTMEKLLNEYRNASNPGLVVNKGSSISRIRDEWDGSQTQYNYDLMVQKKS
jgi:hypothetical protein